MYIHHKWKNLLINSGSSIINKTKNRYLKYSTKYCKFINKMKNKIRVVVVKCLKDTIKVEYIKLENIEGSD